MILELDIHILDKTPKPTNKMFLNWNSGHLEVVKYLVEKGANIEPVSCDKFTPLHWSAFYGNWEYWYLEWKYTNEIIIVLNWYPEHLEVVKYLIERGSNINAVNDEGCTALHLCSKNEYSGQLGQLEIVKYLIEKGADLNAKSNDEITPLHYSCKYGNWK